MPAATSDPARASLAQRALSRSDAFVLGCLTAAAGLAWWWLADADHVSHMSMTGMVPEVWSPAYLGPAFLMWMLMMVAMMLPSAAPMILFYARVARQAPRQGGAFPTAIFAGTYLAVWGLFSAGAALAQAALISLGALSPMRLAVDSSAVAGALLLLAALHQLSPAKRACLAQCRSPLDFVMRLWRPGAAGAVRLGAAHGFYCVGCCWALMVLLFVGGVMDLAWIVALAAVVLLEKLLPPSWPTSGVLAAVLMLAGVALLLA